MTTPLSPTALSKGDFITVLEWTSHRDNSYKGDVLEVQAIDLPFIVCKNHTGYSGGKPLSLNTNAVQLVSLSKEYVDAALGRKSETPPDHGLCHIKPNTYVTGNKGGVVRLADSISYTYPYHFVHIGQDKLNASVLRPATNDEIKAHLVAEAEKRGIRVGAAIRGDESKHSQINPNRILVIDRLELRDAYEGQSWSMLDSSHRVAIDRPFLSVRTKDSYSIPVDWCILVHPLSIAVDGQTYTPTFSDGYVEFGCAKIPNEAFIAAEALCRVKIGDGNRHITHVKIGKGEFSPALLRGLADEIARREASKDDGYDYYAKRQDSSWDGDAESYCVRYKRGATHYECMYANRIVDNAGYVWCGGSAWTKLPNRAAAEALLHKTS